MIHWTAELNDQLTSLYREGLSCSMIAARLPVEVSRNAVIGKLHRLGLTSKGQRPRVHLPSGAAAHKKRRKRHLRMHSVAPKSPKTSKSATALMSIPVIPLPSPDPLDVPLVANLIDLEPHHCRWPIGHVGEPGFGFCGQHHVAGSSYCAHHANRSTEGVEAKRRPFNAYSVKPIMRAKLDNAKEFA